MTKEQIVKNYLEYFIPTLKKSTGGIWDYHLFHGTSIFIYYDNSENRRFCVRCGSEFTRYLRSYFPFVGDNMNNRYLIISRMLEEYFKQNPL